MTYDLLLDYKHRETNSEAAQTHGLLHVYQQLRYRTAATAMRRMTPGHDGAIQS